MSAIEAGLRGVGVVGVDVADPGGEEDVAGFFSGEEFYIGLAGEVEFSAGAGNEVGVTYSHPPIHSCRSNF
jgi:hypothetical protein